MASSRRPSAGRRRGRAEPIRLINSLAPIRVCDNGGWTDTWFARHGKIFNIAVTPYAEVQMRVFRRRDDRPRITIHAENYGQRYSIDLPEGRYNRHPLLEAAIDYMHVPDDVTLDIAIFSEAPSGCSTGTSAAVTVALVGALARLSRRRMSPAGVAQAAHCIETEMLKLQCGIQDQIASAYGGINFIEMHQYPQATVRPLRVRPEVQWELESRLCLVFVGSSHSSSAVHEMVIKELAHLGPETPRLKALRKAAEKARDAVLAGDLRALGRAMIDNTDAQADLHPKLIGPGHQRVIDLARRHGAWGWKVNGAGGAGGSVTLLVGSDQADKRVMIQHLLAADRSFQHIPVHLCPHGLRVWESP